MSPEPRILIVGAGPTGLGAAWRLHELGHTNWNLVERDGHAGGLASSVVDAAGFTWDMGGHVLFSHYEYFDRLMIAALADRWVEHVREAWVWMRERWVPYPFQNNIWRLPPDELSACLDGLLDVHQRNGQPAPASFRDWLLAGFGRGLCDTFLFPYNRKVWGYDPARLDVGWGPNSTFRFPLHGGTGAIWASVAAQLPQTRLRFGQALVAVEPSARTATVADGTSHRYDYLISTIPLDLLLPMLRGRTDLSGRAGEFVHSSSHIVGVGVRGRPPADLTTKCWIYFPEDRVPFYRATVFSNYSPNNVRDRTSQWSLMAEVSESPDKPVDASRVVDEVIAGLVDCRFIAAGDVVSRWHRRLEHGYPTPWLGRDDVLDPIDAALRADGIYSRGRFGAWKYEVSNQDHSVMQGVEAVDHIVHGLAERTYHGDMSPR